MAPLLPTDLETLRKVTTSVVASSGLNKFFNVSIARENNEVRLNYKNTTDPHATQLKDRSIRSVLDEIQQILETQYNKKWCIDLVETIEANRLVAEDEIAFRPSYKALSIEPTSSATTTKMQSSSSNIFSIFLVVVLAGLFLMIGRILGSQKEEL